MTPPSSVASLSVFCLLVLVLPASHGVSSDHGGYKLGKRQVLFKKTSGRSQQASTAVPTAATCSSLTTGLGNNKLPVVHRQSSCSPLQGMRSLTAADVLRRDASLIQCRYSSQSSLEPAPGPSPTPTIILTNGSSHPIIGVPDYSVLIKYGTPEQQLPMFLDTSSMGVSLVRCKPCASGSNDCDPAFDTSQSSTFAHILCGSPDCPTDNCSAGSLCPLHGVYSVIFNGTFVQDVLTLAPSTVVHNFTFFCMDVEKPFDELKEAGTLDMSKHHNSLPSQLLSSGVAATTSFTYCLPRSPSTMGFVTLGGDAINGNDDDYPVAAYAPLVNSTDPELASMYFIDLVGMSLGDEDLPIPADNGTILNVGTTFTMLTPDVYTLLRDSFKKQMSQYNNLSSPVGFDGFDTCFNFTGLQVLVMPNVQFKFSNGDSLMIDTDQMLYYDDPEAGPFTTTCLAFSALDAGVGFSAVIGTHTLASTQVVYDVAGGYIGFIPSMC